VSRTRIAVAVVVGLVLVAAGIALVSVYRTQPELRPTLEFAAAVIGGSGVIFGALYAFLAAAEAKDEARRRRALELIDQLNTPDLVRIQMKFHAWLESASDFSAMNTDLRADAYYYLGLLEDLALNIRARVADEQVLYDSLSFALPNSFKTCELFIKHVRKRNNDATIFDELEKLATTWDRGTSHRTGKKLANPVAARPVASDGDGAESAQHE
jgi:hypothetical protein